MNEEIFRKKSIDKVKSPESLDDYIRVSNPGVWLLLAGIIALLAGALIWGIFGRVDSTVPADVIVSGGEAVCYVAREDIIFVEKGMTVKFSDKEAKITGIGENNQDKYPCALTADTPFSEGSYEGKVIIKSYRPISFIFN